MNIDLVRADMKHIQQIVDNDIGRFQQLLKDNSTRMVKGSVYFRGIGIDLGVQPSEYFLHKFLYFDTIYGLVKSGDIEEMEELLYTLTGFLFYTPLSLNGGHLKGQRKTLKRILPSITMMIPSITTIDEIIETFFKNTYILVHRRKKITSDGQNGLLMYFAITDNMDKIFHYPCNNANCFEIGTKKCAKCKQVRYCSKKCQRNHWFNGYHKERCLTNQLAVNNDILYQLSKFHKDSKFEQFPGLEVNSV